MIARTHWTTEQLATHQRDRLDSLLRQAVANSPYYRRVLGEDAARGQVSLRELPTLTKSTLMDHFDEIVTEGRLRRGKVEAHLAGPSAGELLDGFRVFATAGSTGRRGAFVYSFAEFAVWMAAQVRMLHTMGVTPSMRVAAVGAPDPVHLSRQGSAAPTVARAAANGTTVTVHPLRLRAPFGAFPDVIQYQIAYDGKTLTVRLMLRGGSPAGIPEQIRSALTRALQAAGATPPPITTVRVPDRPGTRARGQIQTRQARLSSGSGLKQAATSSREGLSQAEQAHDSRLEHQALAYPALAYQAPTYPAPTYPALGFLGLQ